jgi:hypothetical protein
MLARRAILVDQRANTTAEEIHHLHADALSARQVESNVRARDERIR